MVDTNARNKKTVMRRHSTYSFVQEVYFYILRRNSFRNSKCWKFNSKWWKIRNEYFVSSKYYIFNHSYRILKYIYIGFVSEEDCLMIQKTLKTENWRFKSPRFAHWNHSLVIIWMLNETKTENLNDEKRITNAIPLWIDYSINIKLMVHGARVVSALIRIE